LKTRKLKSRAPLSIYRQDGWKWKQKNYFGNAELYLEKIRGQILRVQYSFRFYVAEFEPITWRNLNRLVDHYFDPNLGFSEVTSSHWRKYGEYQEAQIVSEEVLLLRGLGFGDYENRHEFQIRNYLINLPLIISTKVASHKLSKEFRGLTTLLAFSTKRKLNHDFLRLGLVAETICKRIEMLDIQRVMIIGDGYGTLGSIISKNHPEITIVQVNLGRSLVFDLAFSAIGSPDKCHHLIHNLSEIKDGAINYLPAEDLDFDDAGIEFFISVESFQEMDIAVVQNYFKLMRNQSGLISVYSANRLKKVLPDGSENKLEEYGWDKNDTVLFSKKPWFLNWGVRRRPPFIFRMDGATIEKMVELSSHP